MSSNDKVVDQETLNRQIKEKQEQTIKCLTLPLRDYYDINLSAILQRGMRELSIQKPQDPIQWLGRYLLENDPENR